MKIFLSSTFIDLKEHRRAVDETINRMTLQYRGMEYFGSRSFEPKSVCFQEIAESDVFVGVYAHRYGWIPSGDILSITEQEYDYAKSIGLPCLLYLIDDTYSWNPQLIGKGESAEKLNQFKLKIASQTISKFTNSDNLAKNIAADLSRQTNELELSEPNRSLNNICSSLTKLIQHDIENTIGPKYISKLFVKRTLSRTYPEIVAEYTRLGGKVKVVQELDKKILRLMDSEAKYFEELTTQNNKKHKRLKNENSLYDELRESSESIEKLPVSIFSGNDLCFPATDALIILDHFKGVCSKIESASSSLKPTDQLSQNTIDSVRNDIVNIKKNITFFHTLVKPITVLIDRAGGGKTNLLCDLSLQLSENFPVFFISAKSVIEPSEESILEYVKIAYPISNNPIDEAIRAGNREESAVLIVIDGINEHYDPGKFNIAIKSFVRRFYNLPVRFLISCRDIYWRFFEDDWWSRHSNEIYRDELKSFRANEFKKALPKYLDAFYIDVMLEGAARQHLCHPLLLRFFCEAYGGAKQEPNRLGIVKDVRLLPLFDTYCERKYDDIRARLNLASSSEISEFVSMIGLIMLSEERRLVPIETVRRRALKQFGETNIHSAKSKYVQILDEDIIIEQKPSRSMHQLTVEFVYDEFMEYVIANAVYSNDRFDNKRVLEKALELISELVPRQAKFVSISGILAFVGEMVAQASAQHGLFYINHLIKIDMKELACQILGRWPEENMSDEVVKILILLHSKDEPHNVRKRAWQALEEIHWRFWKRIYLYMTSEMEYGGFFRISRVFSFLNRSGGGVTHNERFISICWIGEKLIQIKDVEGGNFTSGFSAFKHIYDSNILIWAKLEVNKITKLCRMIEHKSNKKIQPTQKTRG